MSSLQKYYYGCVLDGTIREALLSMKIEGAQSLSQINQLMNLRKASNHPFLFGEPRDKTSGKYLGEANPELLVMASGKLKLLDRMLPALKAKKNKVLIFSQMTQMLDILQDYLGMRDHRCCRLDGSTKLQERQEQIDLFNKDEDVFCFLISTKAGGLGINLTAADTCIIFDRCVSLFMYVSMRLFVYSSQQICVLLVTGIRTMTCKPKTGATASDRRTTCWCTAFYRRAQWRLR